MAKGHIWMVYPSARFSAEGTTICRWDPLFPPVPEQGDEVLLFVFTWPLDADGRIVVIDDSRFLIIGKKGGGKLVMPSLFLLSGELDGITTLDEVELRVRELLGREGGVGAGDNEVGRS